MIKAHATLLLGAAIGLGSLLPIPVLAQDCDRACLEGFMDQVLTAYAAHDASTLPLSEDFRYTENGQDIALDDGLWMTWTGATDWQIPVADPHSGQLAYLSVMEEGGSPVIAYWRMRVEQQQISELELYINRGGMITLDNLQQAKPVFLEAIPEARRVSREDMVRITNSYFSGLDEENSGASVPFHPDCRRQENGAWLANNPTSPGEMQRLSCRAQFDTGFSAIVTDIRERRFTVLDEERGLSYAQVFFDHNGTPEVMPYIGGTTRPVSAPFNRPLSFMIGELFKIVDGQILEIEAIIVTVPYGQPSGWNGEDLITRDEL